MTLSPQVTGIALIVAFLGGSATTWAVTSSSSAEAVSKAEIVAAIKADPALCPAVATAPSAPPPAPSAPAAASLEIPSAEEAQAAFVVEKGSSFPNVKISIGQCDKDTEGPGVACAADIDWGDGSTANGVIGFAKTPTGWKSTHYY
ncbi:hypothetical protein [Sinorhizobium fredii]|uniref:hypothetical protein n=1 Tax=Rhizobium fredii TaxID=380 RepID=UPI0035174B54